MLTWLIPKKKQIAFVETGLSQQVLELGLSLLVGLIVGALLVLSQGFPSKWQQLLIALPIAFTFVMLVNDLEKTVQAAIALSLPLNLDVSLIISPYARNPENIASGHRTLVALTEYRLSLALVLLVIGYAVWLVGTRGSNRKPVRFYSSVSLPALGLLFVSTLSLVQAEDWQLSLFRIAQLVELFLMYLYLANHIRTRQDVQFFITVLMAGMLVESLLMIWQMISGSRFYIMGIEGIVHEHPRRVGGTLENPNVAGGIMAAYLVLVCAMVWSFPKKSQKMFAILCLIAGLLALIGTASRNAWLSFAVALFAFLVIGLWRGKIQRGALVLLAVAILMIGAIFFQTIESRLTADDRGSATSRDRMIKLAWNVIRENAWLGVGANNYALAAPDYYTSDVGYLGYVIDSSVHNAYLLTWAETGLLGLLFHVSLLVVPLLHVWRHVQSSDRMRSLIALGLGCAIVSMGVQMLAESFVPRPMTLFVWLLISLVVGLRNLEPAPLRSLAPERV